MLTLLLPLSAFVVGVPRVATTAPAVPDKVAPSDKLSTTARAAQVRLARTLAAAEAIESVAADGRDVTFAIVQNGAPFHVVVHTTARGTVTAFGVAPASDEAALAHATSAASEGALSWLAEELASSAAVTRLVVDEEGGVIVTTREDRRYMVMPGRGSGGANVAARARWAGAWSGHDES